MRSRSIAAVLAGALAFTVPATAAHGLWSTSASATFTVSVPAESTAPVAPTLTCESGSGRRLLWNTTGASYRVQRSAGATATFVDVATVTATSYLDPVAFAQNEERLYRVVAVTGAQTSQPSNTVMVRRNGNSENHSCVVQ